MRIGNFNRKRTSKRTSDLEEPVKEKKKAWKEKPQKGMKSIKQTEVALKI